MSNLSSCSVFVRIDKFTLTVVFLYFRLSSTDKEDLPPEAISFDIKFETDIKVAYRQIQAVMQIFRDEKRGPTFIAVQSTLGEAPISML